MFVHKRGRFEAITILLLSVAYQQHKDMTAGEDEACLSFPAV